MKMLKFNVFFMPPGLINQFTEIKDKKTGIILFNANVFEAYLFVFGNN